MHNQVLNEIESSFKGKDIISLDQFDKKSIEKVCLVANKIASLIVKKKSSTLLKGKLVVLLFYEPSSRTFSSFSTAIKRLGGQTIDYQNPSSTSSAVKGETMEDTMRVFENYVDLAVIRHPKMGMPATAALAATRIPIINAGDGAGEHPTQALLDLYTIYKKHKRLNTLTILMTGDLLYGRTVHSLLRGLARFSGNIIYLLAPKKLRLPQDLSKELIKKGLKLIEISSDKEIPTSCDVWYWTRVQKERFANLSEYEKIKHSFILTPELLSVKGNKKLILMHPLPRVGEIDTRVDDDERAVYFTTEIQSGVLVRMALLCLVFGVIK